MGVFSEAITSIVESINSTKARKDKKEIEIKKAKQERQDKLCETKPILQIVDYKDIDKYNSELKVDFDIVLTGISNCTNVDNRLQFFYDEKLIDKSKWVSCVYTLKNVGATAIERISITDNLIRNTVIFDASNNDYKLYYDNKLYNNKISQNILIKPNETFTLRVNYIDNKIVFSSIGSAVLTLWLTDSREVMWEQCLFAPTNEISNCSIANMADYCDDTNTRDILECFKNPTLW